MITLSKVDNAIRFTFVDNGHYLFNGTIDVPINSLTLVTDESNMATFKKSATNDIFISATYDELGMSKAELETWYKNNMVGSTGGGGGTGGTTPQEVQEMIDESISGKADTTAVTESISAATADYFDGAEYDSDTTRINFYHGNTVKAYIDASAFIVDGMVDDVRIEEISGVTYLVIDFNTASGKEDIQIPLTDIFDPSNYYNKSEIDAALSGKADTTAVTEAISAATDDMATKTWVGEQGYLTEHQSLSAYSTTEEVNSAITEATSGKVDTSTYETYTGATATEIGNKLAVSDFNTYSGAVDTAINSKASESDLSGLTDVVSAHTANTEIHVTANDKSTWNAKSDFSGSYNDLTDKPTIPTVPTSNTAFTNDAGYITSSALNGYAESTAVTEEISAATSGLQETLVSGTNIKTINNESILGSGNITIQGGGSGNPTVELTQAEYDALVTAGTVASDTYYIITDAQAGDLTQYWTSAQTNSAITEATSGKVDTSTYTAYTAATDSALGGKASQSDLDTVSGNVNTISGDVANKQDTLVSGTNIKTINNESILGEGNITIEGGGGKAIAAGTNISVTTGETADTINCTLPIYVNNAANKGDIRIGEDILNADSDYFKLNIGRKITTIGNSSGEGSISIGVASNQSAERNLLYGSSSIGIGRIFTIGRGTGIYDTANSAIAIGNHPKALYSSSIAIGTSATTNAARSVAIGSESVANTEYSFNCGKYNNSVRGSSTFGDSGNTLFSVGNGTANNARHNAFEIRQNGDIYITSGGTDIKLQDNLGGGGSITIDPTLDSGSTNAVANSAITLAIDAKQDTLSAGTNITIVDNVISATGGGGMDANMEQLIATSLVDLNDRKADLSEVKANYQKKGDYATKSELALKANIADTETLNHAKEMEKITSYALNDLNAKFGGLKLVKITQSEYTALTDKDVNTIYLVVADPNE